MFKKVYTFYLVYLAVMVYSQTLLMLWFQTKGVSYLEMLFYFLVFYVATLSFFFLFSGVKFTSRQALATGVVASGMAVLIASMLAYKYEIYIIAVLFALNIVFFWTIYNTLHFKHSADHEHGYKSGIYFLLSPVFSTVLVPLAGLIAERFGYYTLFVSGVCFYVLPLYLALRLPSFEFRFHTVKALKNLEHKVLVTMQGYIFMLSFNIVPIFTLFYINTPSKLGNFFGFLAVLSALTALANARLSDRLKKRAFFFYTFNILNSISYVPLALASSVTSWSIFASISNLTYGLSNPFNFALTLDHKKQEIVDTMLGREFYLNLGRVIMILVALITFYFTQSLHKALLVSVIVSFAYPLIAWRQKVYLK